MKKITLAIFFAALALSVKSQNILKNGDFSAPIDEKTYGTNPETEGWFIFDWTKGATTMKLATLESDAHGSVLRIESSSDNAWYRSYLGQRLVGVEKAVYVLSFDAKTEKGTASLRCFIREAADRGKFALRNKFDVTVSSTASPAASGINVKDSWKNYKVEFDLSQLVNYFNSVKVAESTGVTIEVTPISDESLKNLIVAIQLANKDGSVLIDNVTLIKK